MDKQLAPKKLALKLTSVAGVLVLVSAGGVILSTNSRSLLLCTGVAVLFAILMWVKAYVECRRLQLKSELGRDPDTPEAGPAAQ